MDTAAECDLFFSGRAEAWALFEELRTELLAKWPDTRMRVMKTCIAFEDPKPYCYISYPPRKHMKGIMLTFGLREQAEHERFFQVVPISRGRFTVHVLVSRLEEIDSELLLWLEASRQR